MPLHSRPRSPFLVMGLLSLLFGCGGSDTPYHKENGVWHFKKIAMSLEDGESLTPINKRFAKSNRGAYFESSSLAGPVDVATFEPLHDNYARDKNSVWFCDTYRDGKEYWSIKHYRTDKIPGADAPSFRMLNSQYARDSKRVYTDGRGFTVRDVDTYERIGDMHAKDRVAGYYLRAEIKGSDGASFSEVSPHYSKDRSHVWWSDFRSDYTSEGGSRGPVEVSLEVPGADPATFVMLEDNYAADTNQVYYEARVLTKAPAQFRVLGRAYAVTETEVFYEGKVLKGADVATFTVLPASPDSATAQDKHGQFNYEKRVKR